MSNPTITSYTREEIIENLKAWMVKEQGHPKDKTYENQDQWYRDYGLMTHFLMDHFEK